MRKEQLQYWLKVATHEEFLDTSNWEHVVDILQTAFRCSRLTMECTWQTGFLITKGDGGFRGIGFV